MVKPNRTCAADNCSTQTATRFSMFCEAHQPTASENYYPRGDAAQDGTEPASEERWSVSWRYNKGGGSSRTTTTWCETESDAREMYAGLSKTGWADCLLERWRGEVVEDSRAEDAA
jgi:hypothetical protein